jgi:high affinity sulfate transporter 1
MSVARRDPARAPYPPIRGWLPTYDRTWLRLDLIAGLTVVALLVPEGMAYAQIAGMPPETAFYAAPIGLVAYAVLGTSRQLVVAVSSTIAVLSASTIGLLAPAGSAEFVALTAALAILAGAISILAGLFRIGRLAQFFSESVLVGFVFGLALVIAVKQVPKVLGIEGGGEEFFDRCLVIIRQLPETDVATAVVGVSSIGLMLLIERRLTRVPAALVVLLVGIAASVVFGLADRGVEVVGQIPAGLAAPKLPVVDLRDLLILVPGAMGIALVNFAEAIGPARGFATRHKYDVDPDEELVALGAANVGAGLFQGFPIGSSLSKSAANDAAGARTPISLVAAAALMALVALFLTQLFAPLPEATLGAIVIVAVLGMMKVGELRRFGRLRETDLLLALVALFGVLVFGVELGLAIAVVTSLLVLVWHASRGRVTSLGRSPTGSDYASIVRHPDHRASPGILVLRPDEPLFFANAESLRASIRDAVAQADVPTRAVVLDLEMTGELDVPALDMLAELNDELDDDGIRLVLARVHAATSTGLERSGLLARLGPDGVHDHVVDAARAVQGGREP